ncbi:B-type cell cycle switch protein ccs52A-like isoform X2 [Corylus avellana]|uniref:B-type cell cycle switch protein ccs52A-like isoform X2 n=1 Tax=Corylus avellana TaxID=13451 RepID=UPI00286BCB1B|nr:B-type cell cycle switch protein ccs52A-like isoform X2 [Corylus avellana]
MDHPTVQRLPSESSELNLTPTRSDEELARLRNTERLVNPNHGRAPSRILSDRFIPSRTGSNFALFHLSPERPEDSVYSRRLRRALFPPATPENGSDSMNPPNRNIFRYQTVTRRPLHSVSLPESYDDDAEVNHFPLNASRKIPKSPYKILDAPGLQDDFHLNLVDWSKHNVLAVGLGNCVYLWNANSDGVTKLCDLGIHDTVCSVGWSRHGTRLAVGTNNGKVQIWDASCCKKVRTMKGHRLRVGALAWSSTLLSSGSRDKSIFQRDIRAQHDYVSELCGHNSEVCGLKWSYDNRQLASGGNDNRLFVWNQNSTHPMLRSSEHTAAVKAIAWSPHVHGLLASGGGTADECIRFWSTTTNSHSSLSCIDTGSSVCNLVWSKNVNELVSTHGYLQNEIIVWRYPAMSKLATLKGHTDEVLYLAISPDGQTIVTGAANEILRFWNVFPPSISQGHRDC